MKIFKIAFILNLALTSFSLYVLIDSFDKEAWRIICSAIGFVVFTILTIVLIRHNKQLKNV